MNIDAIGAFTAHDEVAAVRAPAAMATDAASFTQLFSAGLQEVNRQLIDSQSDLQQLAVGAAPNLHDVMIRLEESRISLQLLMQARGRVLEAYQEVMRMQL